MTKTTTLPSGTSFPAGLSTLINSFSSSGVLYVDNSSMANKSYGSIVRPYKTIQDAVDNAHSGVIIRVLPGVYVENIKIPHNKNIKFIGESRPTIQAGAEWSENLGDIFSTDPGWNPSIIDFENFTFSVSRIAINIKMAGSLVIKDCTFSANGWNGMGLDPFSPQAGSVLGFDSSQVDLTAFINGPNVIENGCAITVANCGYLEVSNCVFEGNCGTINAVDCGYPYAGFISVCSMVGNLCGVKLLSSTGDATSGCERIVVQNNAFEGTADVGVHLQGGYDSLFNINIFAKNWCSAIKLESVSNCVIDKCKLDTNAISSYNCKGQVCGSYAEITVSGSTIKPHAGFITSIIGCLFNRDTNYPIPVETRTIELGTDLSQIVGGQLQIEISNNSINNFQVGLKILQGALTNADTGEKTITLTHKDNIYMDTVETNVDNEDLGPYIEYPFSNIYINNTVMDFAHDVIAHTIHVTPNGNIYNTNQLKAIGLGNGFIRILETLGQRIQYDKLDFNIITIDETSAGSSESEVVNALNSLFANTGSAAPVITSISSFSVIESESVNFSITASNSPTIFSGTNVPPSCIIQPNIGILMGNAPVYIYADDTVGLVANGDTTIATSDPTFDLLGTNLQIGIAQGGGSISIDMKLGSDYTILNDTTITLLGSGQYVSTVIGDDCIFRIGDNVANVHTFDVIASNSFGFGLLSTSMTVLSGSASDIVATFSDTKSIRFRTNDFGKSIVPTTHPFNRTGEGSGSSDAWSVSFWFKAASRTGTHTVWSATNNSASKSNPSIYLRLLNTYTQLIYGSKNNYIKLKINASLRDNIWRHMTISYDGNSTGTGSFIDSYNRFTIYIDNVKYRHDLANISASQKNNGFADNMVVRAISLGTFFNGNEDYGINTAPGLLEEFAIYNNSLSDAEVNELYNSGSPNDLNNTSFEAPHNWWRLGDGDIFPIITDNGSSTDDLELFNMTNADIINDTP